MNHPLRALRGTLFVSLAILVAACATTSMCQSVPHPERFRDSERCRDRECCRAGDAPRRRRLHPVAVRARPTTSP